MKLLFDHNLSRKLPKRLSDLFPGSTQVRLLGLERADDRDVWRLAGRDGYVLVTQDTDIAELAAIHGPPPHVVWLRCGNRPTAFIEDLLRHIQPDMLEFVSSSERACLDVYA